MEVNQIYSLLNSSMSEAFGAAAVNALNLTDIMSYREATLSLGADKFLNTLVDRIGRTVVRTVKQKNTFKNLMMDEYEFGCILQKIDVQPLQASQQLAWEVGDVGFTPNQFAITKPDVRVGVFKKANAWEIDLTIPDQLFKSAFTSEAAMDSFIAGIFDTMETSMEMQIEAEARMQVATFAALKINGSNGVVDLLYDYNQIASTAIYDADAAMCNKDFLRYAGKVMRNYVKYLAKPSKLYSMADANSATYVRSTPESDLNCMVLTEFASACSTYLESETFHDEMVKLPRYEEIEYWQGTGTTAPNFGDCSSINITLDDDAEHSGANPVTVNADGIVGIFVDREALGVGLFDRFSAADRNNRNRYTNYTNGCTIQSFIDTTENGVIFVVQDQTPPSP